MVISYLHIYECHFQILINKAFFSFLNIWLEFGSLENLGAALQYHLLIIFWWSKLPFNFSRIKWYAFGDKKYNETANFLILFEYSFILVFFSNKRLKRSLFFPKFFNNIAIFCSCNNLFSFKMFIIPNLIFLVLILKLQLFSISYFLRLYHINVFHFSNFFFLFNANFRGVSLTIGKKHLLSGNCIILFSTVF